MAKKRTQVTIRTIQRTLVQPVRLRCQQCGAEVPIITPENAAGVLQTTPREIHGLLESGALHTVAAAPAADLICGNSLSATTDSETQTQFEGEEQ